MRPSLLLILLSVLGAVACAPTGQSAATPAVVDESPNAGPVESIAEPTDGLQNEMGAE